MKKIKVNDNLLKWSMLSNLCRSLRSKISNDDRADDRDDDVNVLLAYVVVVALVEESNVKIPMGNDHYYWCSSLNQVVLVLSVHCLWIQDRLMNSRHYVKDWDQSSF